MHREMVMKQKVCPECGGAGETPNLVGPDYLGDYVKCGKCGGSGYIVEPEVEVVPDEDDKEDN